LPSNASRHDPLQAATIDNHATTFNRHHSREHHHEVRIRWFLPVRWWVVLQRHYGGGFRIAVSFSVRCGLLLLDLYRRRVAFAGFDDYMGGMLAVAVGNEGELKF